MGPIRNPGWEQKWTEGYVIVSIITRAVYYISENQMFIILFLFYVGVWQMLTSNVQQWGEVCLIYLGKPWGVK
jgi:hypothetical protein